jgi:hypothetical protein
MNIRCGRLSRCENGEEVEINSLQRRRTIHRAHCQGSEGDEGITRVKSKMRKSHIEGGPCTRPKSRQSRPSSHAPLQGRRDLLLCGAGPPYMPTRAMSSVSQSQGAETTHRVGHFQRFKFREPVDLVTSGPHCMARKSSPACPKRLPIQIAFA